MDYVVCVVQIDWVVWPVSMYKVVWGISLCLPPARVGRHIDFPLASVCLSVCLSVTKSCPLYNSITVTVITMKLHTFVKHIETTCHAQEP